MASTTSSRLGSETGENRAISPTQVSSALGNDTLGQFASKAGIDIGEAPTMLAGLLPSLANPLTPQGRVPESNELDGALGSLLAGLGR